MRIPRFRVAALMGLVLVAALVFGSLRFASVLWAASLLMATLGAVVLAAMAALYRRGSSRAFWLGFAVFATAYLGLTSAEWWPDRDQAPIATRIGLEAALPYVDPDPIPDPDLGKSPGGPMAKFSRRLFQDPGAPDRKLREALKATIAMPFPQETSLEDVIKYVKSATVSPAFPTGIPIYIDPVGLQEAEKTMTSPVTFDVEGVALKESLKLILKQLDLAYRIENGLLTITHDTDVRAPFDPDAYHRIGHCWWALLLGVFGGLGTRRLHDTGAEPAGV